MVYVALLLFWCLGCAWEYHRGRRITAAWLAVGLLVAIAWGLSMFLPPTAPKTVFQTVKQSMP